MDTTDARKKLKGLFGNEYHHYIDATIVGDFAVALASKFEELEEELAELMEENIRLES